MRGTCCCRHVDGTLSDGIPVPPVEGVMVHHESGDAVALFVFRIRASNHGDTMGLLYWILASAYDRADAPTHTASYA